MTPNIRAALGVTGVEVSVALVDVSYFLCFILAVKV
jgi:hypothetical protein